MCVALFGVLLAAVYRYDNKYTAGPPYGEGGVFLLTENDLDQPIFLIDGWLLNGQDVFIGEYSNFSFLPGGASPFGTGNYELTLRYDGEPVTLLLEIPPIFTEYTLALNGRPAAQTGSDAQVAVPLGQGDVRISLHTVNRSHYYSGLTYPPALGTAQAMGHLALVRTLVYAGLCTAALTLALFSLGLWMARARDGMFLHFGVLCLAVGIRSLHPFIWQLWGYSSLWYAVEDGSWLLTMAQAGTLCALAAGLETSRWYRWGFRPISLAACLLTVVSVLFIIPNAGGFVNFYGFLIDGYKLIAWFWLVLCGAWGFACGIRAPSFLVLTACGLLGVSLLAGMGDSNAFEPICGLWQSEYAALALVLLFGVWMAVRNRRLLQDQAELQSVRIQYRFAQESAAQTRASMEQLRSLKHELRHHVETLNALCQAREWERLGAYLTQLGAAGNALPSLYYTEHFLVNAILAGKLGPAQARGIRVDCRAHLPPELPMADADLCILLSNLLDNALEACERVEDPSARFVELELELRGDLLLIRCVNTAPPRPSGGPFVTTKPDMKSHGLGIPAMGRVVEQYHGVLELSQEGEQFTLRAALHMETPK